MVFSNSNVVDCYQLRTISQLIMAPSCSVLMFLFLFRFDYCCCCCCCCCCLVIFHCINMRVVFSSFSDVLCMFYLVWAKFCKKKNKDQNYKGVFCSWCVLKLHYIVTFDISLNVHEEISLYIILKNGFYIHLFRHIIYLLSLINSIELFLLMRCFKTEYFFDRHMLMSALTVKYTIYIYWQRNKTEIKWRVKDFFVIC